MLHLSRYHKVLKERLTPKRYHHSVCVQQRAAQLAKLYGVDWFKAGIAGLLHDVCQCEPTDAQLKYLRAHAILLDDFYLAHPPLWHALCGRVYLEEQLKIRDPEILSAVRYHTTGRPAMTALEQVVYLADATSKDRDYPGVEELRTLSEQSLDAAMFSSLRHTVEMLVNQGQPIVSDCAEAYNYYWLHVKHDKTNAWSLNGMEDII